MDERVAFFRIDAGSVMAAMRSRCALHSIFNVEVMGRMSPERYIAFWTTSSCEERQAMMKSKNVVAALRRDAHFVLNAVIAVVFIGFAGIVVAAALIDLLAIHN